MYMYNVYLETLVSLVTAFRQDETVCADNYSKITTQMSSGRA